jgi:hypothetical protein
MYVLLIVVCPFVLFLLAIVLSVSDTRRVNLVANPVISHEQGKDREVFKSINNHIHLIHLKRP